MWNYVGFYGLSVACLHPTLLSLQSTCATPDTPRDNRNNKTQKVARALDQL
jgi:hypothetical protein